jgi:hypothetical protein
MDNEILTDITAVFLGFGKIMLNGCRASRVMHEPTPNGTRSVTETMTAGYLDRGQLAFAYRLICAMRNIPPQTYLAGLNKEAQEAIRNCDARHAHHYDSRFHRVEDTTRRIRDFTSRVVVLQRTMGHLQKHVTYIRRGLCAAIDEHVVVGHKTAQSLEAENRERMEFADEPDPALRFLKAIKAGRELSSGAERLDSVLRKTEGLLDDANTVGRYVRRSSRGFPVPSAAMFTVVTCPNDGTSLRLPEGSDHLIVICPKCKYRFPYNTGPLVFGDERPLAVARPRATWLRRLRGMLRLPG